MHAYRFEKDQVPVSQRCAVLVAGGGTAGAVAGISAARQGADTLIVEQYGALGGSQTMALVTPIMHTNIPGDPQSSAIAEEIYRAMQARGAASAAIKGYFDPLALKDVLEDMVTASGCRLLYHTTVIGTIKEGDRITHAVVFNQDGISAIEAALFIDATADGSLSLLAGASCDSGNEKGRNQAVSLRFIMEGVDSKAFEDYLVSIGEENQRRYPLLHTASVKDNPRWKLEPVFRKAHDDGLLTEQDIKYFQCFSLPGRPGALAFNCPELGSRVNVLDPDYLTDRQVEGKRAVGRIAAFLRARVPGFAGAYVAEIAPMVGIRESRRIHCEYTLTGQDVASYAKFDDFIATSNYPIDIHDAGDDTLQLAEVPMDARYYQIPMRSLVVRGLDNLFVVGRCIGTDFVAQSSARVQASCRATGEAAGIAAALAAKEDVPARAVGGARVRGIMTERGAQFV